MQGLAHYGEASPSPPRPSSSPSRPPVLAANRRSPPLSSRTAHATSHTIRRHHLNSPTTHAREREDPIPESLNEPDPSQVPSAARARNDSDSAPSSSKSTLDAPHASDTTASNAAPKPPAPRPSKRPRRSPPPPSAPENLTHTAQASLPSGSTIPSGLTAAIEDQGMTEDQLFLRVTRPPDLPGVDDWGIPPEVDPTEATPALTNKVEQFLRLKRAGQHVNTNLLASSAFANPHIYSKLVEFVDIEERATAFPSSGWLTRRNLEDMIPTYGPNALSEQQRARQEARRAAQEPGKRSEIKFAPARKEERDERERGAKGRDGRRENGAGRERDKGREWDKGGRDRYRR